MTLTMKTLTKRINKIMSKYKHNIKTHVWHLPYLAKSKHRRQCHYLTHCHYLSAHTRDAAELIVWKVDMNL